MTNLESDVQHHILRSRPIRAGRADRSSLSRHRSAGVRAFGIRHSPARGLSLVEMLVSLAITAMLLTATMVAIDASFRAYAFAAETASRQTSTRLVVHRLLGLVRNSIYHEPLGAAGTTITSDYIEILDSDDNDIRIEYRSDVNELWLIRNPQSASPQAQPLLAGVRDCEFHLQSRRTDDGVLVLQRFTIEMNVERDEDQTLAIDSGRNIPIEVIASTMPRKLE